MQIWLFKARQSPSGFYYSAIAAEDLKDYKVSGTANGDFGDGIEVIQATETGGTCDRFYVMALEDFVETGNLYYWYYSAECNELTEVVTDYKFGTGKANTIIMIEKWNSSAFGEQNADDMWGAIQENEKYDIVDKLTDSGKWFVPSFYELIVFWRNLELEGHEDPDTWEWIPPCNLSTNYWSSSRFR